MDGGVEDVEQDRQLMISIEKALENSAGGDHSAFSVIVHHHQSMVFSLALHFMRNRELAEELSQDVFLELYRNIHSIRTADHLKFWLRRVTSHRCIDVIRKQPQKAMVGLEDAPEPAIQAEELDPLMSDRLRRLVASLPDKQRMVIILRYQEDLDPTEIAAMLDMPVNTVKSHLKRALSLLREKLSGITERYTYEAAGR